MSGGCTGGQPGIHWLLGHNADCVPDGCDCPDRVVLMYGHRDRCPRGSSGCSCTHAAGEHSVSGCEDGCSCEGLSKCGPVPDECDPETGEPCARHEAAMAEGVPDHLYHESCPGVCCGGNKEL